MNTTDREFIVEKIRTQYTEKTDTALDEIKKLDKKVKKPANIFACVFGSFAAIILGCGMSLIMTDISETVGVADSMQTGIIIGVAGMVMAIANYPIYKAYLGSRRKKYAKDIIELSDKIK